MLDLKKYLEGGHKMFIWVVITYRIIFTEEKGIDTVVEQIRKHTVLA